MRLSVPIRLGISLIVVLQCAQVSAQIASDEGASILFFPRVVADENTETFIQIANGSLLQRKARCSYVAALDGARCEATDFAITLSQRQPTHWIVSTGRPMDLNDPACHRGEERYTCDGAGFDPGEVPALSNFRGHLFCVQVDASGAPIGGNALRGAATIKDLRSGDVRKYNAVGLTGFMANDGDDVLCLGGGVSAACPRGAEYSACPGSWILMHPPEGTVEDSPTTAHTYVAAIPCEFDLTALGDSSAVLQMTVVNELEQRLSVSVVARCSGELALGEVNPIFDAGILGTAVVQTMIRPSGDSPGAILGAAIARQTDGSETTPTWVAVDVHSGQANSGQDVMRIAQP